jgi:predicted nucleic acid-binding Zn finger protein
MLQELMIALTKKLQSGNGEYNIVYNGEWKCSCPDFIHRKEKCKHIFAVDLAVK